MSRSQMVTFANVLYEESAVEQSIFILSCLLWILVAFSPSFRCPDLTNRGVWICPRGPFLFFFNVKCDQSFKVRLSNQTNSFPFPLCKSCIYGFPPRLYESHVLPWPVWPSVSISQVCAALRGFHLPSLHNLPQVSTTTKKKVWQKIGAYGTIVMEYQRKIHLKKKYIFQDCQISIHLLHVFQEDCKNAE